MTKYFEILRRDGPARMGKLLLNRQISTPGVITPDDYLSAGSIYSYNSLDEAIAIQEGLKGQKKLAILPYVPSALHSEPALELPAMDLDGPKGLLVHPFREKTPEGADVYLMGNAGSLKNPRDLVKAIIGVRDKTAPDSALYAPALATPANLALLVYLGIDLIDGTRMIADGLLGRYHTRDGVWSAKELAERDELFCLCPHCQKMREKETRQETDLLVAHNLQKLDEELLAVREAVRSQKIREYVERQVRVTPDQTAALRLLDAEHRYLERRTPVSRRSIFYANCAESLQRVEVTRFAERVLERYQAPQSDVLLLLPCSARKPYSTSRSHRLFAEAIGSARRYLHELILTSPLALVPRELEEAYPAASYDVPVTGRWDREERAWLAGCLKAYLKRNRYVRIVAHLDGELEQTMQELGLDAVYTGGGTSGPALARLGEAVKEACRDAARLPDLRLLRYRAHADFYFGQGAGDALLAGKIVVRGREIQDENKRPLATWTINGNMALSMAGAKRLEPLGRYTVRIGDFLPRGSLLAPGVVDADEEIRPGDEVIVEGEQAFGIGRAKMSGWEMVASRRGVAVEIRHIKER
ncbi:archaeosine synthase subunit alpha [Methanothrix soehngenii]|jgi:archaeosine synthase|uniref:archaeosine synthase subunit alpha n=1 Tax=Methanothrix soehngenii TaxID=2223 RepID=UPI003141B023